MTTGEIHMGEVIHKMRDGRTMHWRPMPGAPLRIVTVGGGRLELQEEIRTPGGRRIGRFRGTGSVRVAREDSANEAFRPMQGTRIEPVDVGLAAKLYVGLNVGSEPAWTEKDVEEAVLVVRKEQGVDPGASIMLQLGIYEQDGSPVEEQSVAVGIIDMHHTPKDVWERQMQELASALRERFSQDSILVEMQENGRTTHIFQAKGPIGPWLDESAEDDSAYVKAKKMCDDADNESKAAGAVLDTFPKRANGLTPDEVKFSPEYRAAKARFDAAFARQRKVNAWFSKTFQKELRAERNARGR